MTLHRYVYQIKMLLFQGVCSFCALSAFSQTDSDSAIDVEEAEQSTEFEILSEQEIQSYQEEQYGELKNTLEASSLSSEYQDLIATVLSESIVGVPVSTYVQQSVAEGTDTDPTDEIERMTILDTGMIENDGSRSYSLDGSNTPFPHIALVPLDPASGQVLTETDSEIVFRFGVDIKISEEEEIPDFFANMINDLALVVDFTIDRNTQSMQTATFQLLKPLRKLFLFKLKTFKITYNYEFNENCGCLAVKTMNMDMGGSILFLGNFFAKASVTYSDVQCEKPLRYIHLDRHPDQVFSLMF